MAVNLGLFYRNIIYHHSCKSNIMLTCTGKLKFINACHKHEYFNEGGLHI